MPHIDGMKSEIIKYQALVKSIKPLDQRKDAKGKDTFVLSDWWRCNSGELPHFAFVLRAVLTNAPNSCPPERLFSMFNATFGEDQKSSFGDYLELAMQSQYNKRNHQEKGAPCCSHYFCMLTCRNDPFYMFNMVAGSRCML